MAESQVTDLSTPKPAAQAAAVSTAKKVITKQSGHDGGMSGVTKVINIYASEQEGGNFAVLLGHNGVMYQIPRGIEVEVPEEIVDILRNAITTVTLPAEAGGVTTREVPRYNFQVLG